MFQPVLLHAFGGDLLRALDVIGEAPARLMVNESVVLSGDCIMPATVELDILPGCIISGPHTLTINGALRDCLHQIFGADLAVTAPAVQATAIRPEWFGAFADKVDCTAAFQRAVDLAVSTDGRVPLLLTGGAAYGQRYKITDTMTISGRIVMRGVNRRSSQILFVVDDDRPCLALADAEQSVLTDFGIVGSSYRGTGLQIGTDGTYSSRCIFERLLIVHLEVGVYHYEGIEEVLRDVLWTRCMTNLHIPRHTTMLIDNPIMEGWGDYGLRISSGQVRVIGGCMEGGGCIGVDPLGIAVKAEGGRLKMSDLWLEDNVVDVDADGVRQMVVEDCVMTGVARYTDVGTLRLRQPAVNVPYNKTRFDRIGYKDIQICFGPDDNGARMFVDNTQPSKSLPALWCTHFEDFAANGWDSLSDLIVDHTIDPALVVSHCAPGHTPGGCLELHLTGDGSWHRDLGLELSLPMLAELGWRDLVLVARVRLDANSVGIWRSWGFTYDGGKVGDYMHIREPHLNVGPEDWFWCHLPISVAAFADTIPEPNDVTHVIAEFGAHGTDAHLWIDSLALLPGPGFVLPP